MSFRVSIIVCFIPLHTLAKRITISTKDIQCTSNRQVNLSSTAMLDAIQITQTSGPAGVGDRKRAPFDKAANQWLVDTQLHTLDVSGMDEELRTVRFNQLDVFYL